MAITKKQKEETLMFQKLGERFRAKRAEMGIPVIELARTSGLSHVFILKVENGDAGGVQLKKLYELAGALKMEVDISVKDL